IIDLFFETNQFYVSSGGIQLELVADRLRGETALFDIMAGDQVIVEQGRKVTAKHIRELKKAEVEKLTVSKEYLVGRILAHDIIDTDTGEVILNINDELTEESVEKLIDSGVTEFKTLYTNDLDRGPYISNTLRVDQTTSQVEAQVEIYR
ncbi:MAG TPA: DNA-directed RNA polymerase subunit beta, partial [Gammaproteobacteria bacterium]|nr:DNA-directed RNA polymerase subunit beta [Gammaproteobacteria bacterium]